MYNKRHENGPDQQWSAGAHVCRLSAWRKGNCSTWWKCPAGWRCAAGWHTRAHARVAIRTKRHVKTTGYYDGGGDGEDTDFYGIDNELLRASWPGGETTRNTTAVYAHRCVAVARAP